VGAVFLKLLNKSLELLAAKAKVKAIETVTPRLQPLLTVTLT